MHGFEHVECCKYMLALSESQIKVGEVGLVGEAGAVFPLVNRVYYFD